MYILANKLMKKIYVLFVIATLGFASCGRNYTCPVYSKANLNNGEEVQASTKQIEKGKN